ncbi:rho family-interacting cell polarization regulator 2-like [Labrus mixtus]|uniref:rho family-interacting cell polarization regulator 2-like n=1 Tax=Labrus mixtus TaxID=508554 RepID=UPI0029C07D9E|nr:rho family-interacting cell polarization regulator 2-like [Labrus mixtus]
MFTGSTKLPPTKNPQPERLDEVYAALRRGLQSYLQVHQLELESLGQQIRENKRNGRLGSLYEQDKQVKAIERFMRRLEFHLSKVEELYDAYCIQRRLRDGASKMVAAFNSASGSKEARESLSEANKGYRECTEHMCSLESEIESQMGEFHVKMKGLAGFARLCAGDQYEVLMRYGRQRWRLRGRVEVSNKQIWDSEEYIFLPLVTELLSIKVTELKSLANHVVVGSVSCEMLDLFCPLPQTLAVDINDLGTVKLNLEVTWSPFDKDDQTSSSSTVSKRLLSNQSPPDTPSMREQVFYSLLKRQGEMENGTVWSNSSESSDDSSSPALAHHAQRLTASNMLPTTLTSQLSLTPHRSSASTPSLSSNQEEDETERGEVFSQTDAVPNGHLQTHAEQRSADCSVTDRASVQSADVSESSADLSCSCPDVSSVAPVSLAETTNVSESGVPQVCVSAEEVKDDAPEQSSERARQTEAEDDTTEAAGEEHHQAETSEKHSEPHPSIQKSEQPEDASTVPFPTSSSFTQELETALESFDFLNCSDLDEEEEEDEEQKQEDREEKEEDDGQDKEEQPKLENKSVEEENKEEEEDDDAQEKEEQHKMDEETVGGKENEEQEEEEEEEDGTNEEEQQKTEKETMEEVEKEEVEGGSQEEESQNKLKNDRVEDEEKEDEKGQGEGDQQNMEKETAEEEEKEEHGRVEENQKEMEDKAVEEEMKEEHDDDDGQHAQTPNNSEETLKEEEKKEEEKKEEEISQNKIAVEELVEEQKEFYSGRSDDEEGGELEILMEAPEGFRNSDEDCFSDSQESSVEDVQDWLRRINRSEDLEEHSEEKGDEEKEEERSHDQEERSTTPGHLATTVF